MKIAIVNPYSAMPGESWAPYRSEYLARALEIAGHQTDILVSHLEHRRQFRRGKRDVSGRQTAYIVQKYGFISSYDNTGLSRAFFEFQYSLYFLFFYFLKNKILRRKLPDIVILAEPSPVSSTLVHLLLRIFRSKSLVVYDVLDLFPEGYWESKSTFIMKKHATRVLKKLRSVKLKRADGLVFCSVEYERSLKGDNKFQTIYIGSEKPPMVAPSEFAKAHPLLEGWLKKNQNPIILYCGTLGKGYGLDKFLQNYAASPSLNSKFRVVIAGSGPPKVEMQLNEITRNFSEKVMFCGPVRYEHLPQLFEISDFGLICYEVGSSVSMPLKFFDYVTHGLPMLNNSTGEAAKIIEDYNLGVNVPSGDWTLLDDQLVGFRREEANFDLLANSFRPNHMYRGYVSFLEELDQRKQDDKQ